MESAAQGPNQGQLGKSMAQRPNQGQLGKSMAQRPNQLGKSAAQHQQPDLRATSFAFFLCWPCLGLCPITCRELRCSRGLAWAASPARSVSAGWSASNCGVTTLLRHQSQFLKLGRPKTISLRSTGSCATRRGVGLGQTSRQDRPMHMYR